MESTLFIDILGWLGMILILLAFGLNSFQKLGPSDSLYQWINIVGAVLLIINSFVYKAYPFTLLNSVWTLVAVMALVKIWKAKRRDKDITSKQKALQKAV